MSKPNPSSDPPPRSSIFGMGSQSTYSSLYPHSKPPGTSAASSASPSGGSNPAVSPNPPPASTVGASSAASAAGRASNPSTPGLRPSYGLGSAADRSRGTFPTGTHLSRPSEPASATAPGAAQNQNHAHTHSHSVPPHHHHHHHHHVHAHTPGQPSSAASTPSSSAGDRASTTPSTTATGASSIYRPAGTAAADRDPVRRDSFLFGRGLGSLFSDLQQERAARERELRQRQLQQQAQRDAEAKRAADEREKQNAALLGRTSPKTSTSTSTLDTSDPYRRPGSVQTSPKTSTVTPSNPYARPNPPSPTNTRTLPGAASASASASAAAKPSISPQLQSASAASARPNLPGLSSIAPRSLPSPFDIGRERSGSITTPQDTPGHHRTLSGSTKTSEPLSGIGQRSPEKPSPAQANPAARGLYSAPPPLAQAPRDSSVQRSPVARSSATVSPRQQTREPPKPATATAAAGTAAAAAKPGTPTAASTATSQPPRSNPYGLSYATSGYAPYLGIGGAYGGYGMTWQEREKAREREREREKERVERELERKRRMDEEQERYQKAREEEHRMWKRMREDYEREAQRKREERERENKERIAAYEQKLAAKSAAQARPPAPTATPATTTSTAATGYDPYLRQAQAGAGSAYGGHRIEVLNEPARPAETASVIQQVAPQREPRPYGYKTENRDYQYQPREKRPRMDAAVEEQAHRRGSVGKSKRRKEEVAEKAKEVPAPRDWAALVQPNKRDPEVSSAPVERWLKELPELDRVISRELYGGTGWTLARSGCTDPENAGGLVHVRVGGSFLGKGWKVRGELDWDSATPQGTGESEVGLAWAEGTKDERRAWGTDVYTDDSDLGLVLVHAGWLRWGGSPDKSDNDQIDVTVRIVPTLVRYTSTERNGIRTRGWGNGHDGMSIVVEGVERIKVDNKWLSTRSNRKARMADYARQRLLILPLEESTRANTLDTVMLADSGEGGMKYSPDMLVDFLDQDQPRSLWTHELVLTADADKYCLALFQSDLSLELTQVLPGKTSVVAGRKRRTGKPVVQVLATGIPAIEFHWVPEGLAVRTKGRKGLLCPFERFRWAKNGEGEKEAVGDDDEEEDEAEGMEEVKEEVLKQEEIKEESSLGSRQTSSKRAKAERMDVDEEDLIIARV